MGMTDNEFKEACLQVARAVPDLVPDGLGVVIIITDCAGRVSHFTNLTTDAMAVALAMGWIEDIEAGLGETVLRVRRSGN